MSREFTGSPEQLHLIDQYRDINVHDEWYDCTIEEFVEQMEAYGFSFTTHTVGLVNGKTREEPDVFFSGFCSQGDGACFGIHDFTLSEFLQAGQKVMSMDDGEDLAYLKDCTGGVPQELRTWFEVFEREYGTCLLSGELMALLDCARFKVELSRRHYEHSGNISVEMVWDGEALDDYTEADQQVAHKLEDEIGRVQQMLRAIADELYDTLEQEYDYLTDDEQVWEAIVANDLDEDDDDDEANDEEEQEEEGCLA